MASIMPRGRWLTTRGEWRQSATCGVRALCAAPNCGVN
jgi:hypothetical protein